MQICNAGFGVAGFLRMLGSWSAVCWSTRAQGFAFRWWSATRRDWVDRGLGVFQWGRVLDSEYIHRTRYIIRFNNTE